MTRSSATLAQAHALHNQGRLAEAVSLYREVLATEPLNGDALHLMGLALVALGDAPQALRLIGAAAQLQPGSAAVHANLGGALSVTGRYSEALSSYDRALALQPDLAVAHRGRGTALIHLGKPEEALASFREALRLVPSDDQACNGLGVALERTNRPEEARQCFTRAIALNARNPDAHHNLGLLEATAGRHAQALASFERARALSPGEFAPRFYRGVALAALERYEESVASFDEALALNGDSAEALNNRGAVLVRLFRPAEALLDFDRAVRLRPDYADAHLNAGLALRGLGRYVEALNRLDRALAIRSDFPTATWTKAVIKLATGEFGEGWPLYEARLRLEPACRSQRPFGRPRWSGAEPLAGKTLLIYADQGLGDTLQFCRYIPLLEAQGARVVFEVQPVLKQLLGSLAMRGTLIERGEPLRQFDLQSPLGSVPLAVRTDLDTIPVGVPYLHVDPAPARAWAERLSALPGLKVGLNWHGNPEAERLAALEARSFPLSKAAPLARIPGVSLVSLQKGAGAEQRTRVDFAGAIAQLTDPAYMGSDEIANETAAILIGLDLVITADTALAHLAGALGARVWVVLQAVPDWRWLIERADSPWYPTMRLFRQRTLGDWPEVFERVAAELAVLARTASGGPR